MKEWALKHPILTFLLLDSAVAAAANTIHNLILMIRPELAHTCTKEEVEEENKDESGNDIQ